VRWDGGITTGSVVGLNYDPMLAKLIVHAPTRELAIARMERALRELVIHGVETSREFHLRMMADEDYRASNVTIQWLEAKLPEILARKPSAETVRVAVIAAALFAQKDRGGRPRTGVAAMTGAPEATAIGAASGFPSSATLADPSRAGWAEQARREALRGA
jgi:acetyl-CoA carboxylase biotin carboxylase subunit